METVTLRDFESAFQGWAGRFAELTRSGQMRKENYRELCTCHASLQYRCENWLRGLFIAITGDKENTLDFRDSNKKGTLSVHEAEKRLAPEHRDSPSLWYLLRVAHQEMHALAKPWAPLVLTGKGAEREDDIQRLYSSQKKNRPQVVKLLREQLSKTVVLNIEPVSAVVVPPPDCLRLNHCAITALAVPDAEKDAHGTPVLSGRDIARDPQVSRRREIA